MSVSRGFSVHGHEGFYREADDLRRSVWGVRGSAHNGKQKRSVSVLDAGEDIAEWKQPSVAILQNQRQHQFTLDAIPAMVWQARADGYAEYFNKHWTTYTGCSVHEARGWGWQVKIHPEDRPGFLQHWRTMLDSGAPGERDARLRRSDGEYRWFQFRTNPVRDVTGDIVSWYGTSTDIEELKRAKASALQQEKELKRILDRIPSILFYTNPAGELEYCNKRWIEYTGMSVKNSFGWGWTDSIHPDDLAGLIKRWGEVVQSGRPGEAEARMRRFDGQYLRFMFRADCFRDEAGNIVKWYGAAADIEDRKLTSHAALAHVTRATALDELMASIAHEVNQPLTGIVTNGEACLRWLVRGAPDLDEAQSAVQRIISDGRRASDVIHRLRALSMKEGLQKAPLNLNEVIENAVLLIRRELREHRVSLNLSLTADLPAVLGDDIQLQQVLINLMLNAAQATSNVSGRPRSVCVRSEPHKNNGVQVTVTDTGVGIDPANLNQLFNAFFTTKPGGMGMGLSICRSIIEAHGGRVWGSNNDGSGATFGFILNQATEAP